MNIVGLDTCFGACSVAVGTGIGSATARLHGKCDAMQTGHAERLIPMTAEVLREAGLEFQDLHRMAVTVGPGSFTGSRICLSAARAFALAHDLPIVPFSSLEVIAASPRLQGLSAFTDLLVAMNANRGEVYVQRFDALTREPRSDPQLLTIDGAAGLGGMKCVAIAGSAAHLVAEAAAEAGREPQTFGALLPDIRDILERAALKAPAPTPPGPLYLRPPDAKPQAGKSLPRAS